MAEPHVPTRKAVILERGGEKGEGGRRKEEGGREEGEGRKHIHDRRDIIRTQITKNPC